ncbi:MAG: RICIN domain-containing protein, partial [Alphaproteobacteria bacterium]|nr:RICIN domain-containing protein [Alphaproteobacteria bacterium]
AKVDDLTKQINAERAKVRKERAAVEAKLKAAEDRVNSLNHTIDRDWDHYHGCSGWFSWACKARWGIEIGILKGARDVADAALKLAETTVDHFPLDFDPRIAPLIVARDAAHAALTAALDAFEGADFFDKILKEVGDEVASIVGKSVNIHQAKFEGDLKGLISGDQPLAVTLNAEVFGTQIEQIIPFNPRNVGYDVEQMSFLGLRALHHIVDEVLKDIPGPIKSKILNYTTSQMGIQQDAAKKELAKYGKAFAGYEKQEAALQKVIAARDKAYVQERYAEAHNPLDHGVSETFTNDFIEVGHTALCLDNINGAIKQDRCKDTVSTRWSTKPVDGATKVPAKAGFVHIIDAKTGNCIVPEGKWAEVKKEFTGPNLPKGASFFYTVDTFQGDGKINVAKCENKSEYYWKILKHGEGWMQMANRATSQCLHFKDNSSLPGQATAEWAACVGSANQVYRVADKTTPEYYASNIALKNDSESACFSNPANDGTVTMVDCTKGAKYNYVIDIRGYIKFINTKTGQCIQPATYQNGAHLIEKPCTQLDYQWWNPVTVPGGWRIQNAQTNTCTRAPGLGQVAVTETCKDWAESIIAPVVDPYSGITYTTDASAYLTPVIVRPHTTEKGSDAGICTAQVAGAGDTHVIGTVSSDRKCRYVYNKQEQSVPAGGANKSVTVLDGTVWQAHSLGKDLPSLAIPGGVIDKGAQSKAVYICRVRINYKDTKFGWIADLEPNKQNYCNYPSMNNSEDDQGYQHAAHKFEVLVRSAEKAYVLHLSDLKPGGSQAGTDKALTATETQKGLYTSETGVRPAASRDDGQHGIPLNGWKADSGQYGPPTIAVVGDIVTLKGRVFGGSRPFKGFWKLPDHVNPTSRMVFNAKSSAQGVSHIIIQTDGTMIAFQSGNFPSSPADRWIDLSSVVYSTSSKVLKLEQGWTVEQTYRYEGPTIAKVGRKVVLGGVAARHGDGMSLGYNEFVTVLQLPDGLRPEKQLTFNLATARENSLETIPVTITTDGKVQARPRNLKSVSFYGLSFEAALNAFDRATEYGPLKNGWKDNVQQGSGYGFSLDGDMVTLEGAVTAGQRGTLWTLSEKARPNERLVFRVKSGGDNPIQLDIQPNGDVSATDFFYDFRWLDLSNVTFSRRPQRSLSIGGSWAKIDGYAAPTATKIGNKVVVTGAITRAKLTKNQGEFGFDGSSNSDQKAKRLLTILPEDMRPMKTVRFGNLAMNITTDNPHDIRVDVHPDGRIEVPGNIYMDDAKSISLSGITFNTR